ncbi:peptidase S9 [Cnuibacter physcomitrellae]|uniref:S9 family peptidase n=1 Tax=Cnuibacter physcomitrellae TaxID=1619308 RepID=A0A1X9LGR4_9MICO|nr:S9 family peptidase [Cnuibacter physcomitrellae]ARJ04406.1 S9 family peptidase [Cnuibacter physcomitrellae]GGI40972.1 peptidase S9 [Cnuibacter physcomitrellae]
MSLRVEPHYFDLGPEGRRSLVDRVLADRLERARRLAVELSAAWGSWGPTMTPDAGRVAFVSDRSGSPELWVQDVVLDGPPPEAVPLRFTDDPVVSVSWSADSAWLACAVATGGGVRTQVWVVRPDGTDARLVAGSSTQHAELGPWTRSGHRVIVTLPAEAAGEPTRAFLADPATGSLEALAEGDLIHVLDLSAYERMLVLRDGPRGHEFCVVVDRERDEEHPLMPHPARGATDRAIIRPAPAGSGHPGMAYFVTEVGLPRRQLVSLAIDPDDWSRAPEVLAVREDAELEALDADDAGRRLLLVWNVAGRSELELYDTVDRVFTPITGLPGAVATSPVLSRDGESVVLAVEGPQRPRELWHLEVATLGWTRVTDVPELPGTGLVEPSLERYEGLDGLEITGWLYRATGSGAATGGRRAAMLHLHGGPESQERPVFSAQHQAMAAAGISVLAPNVRGSSGFGREFGHADDVHGRQGAFDDVTASARHLVEIGVAEEGRLAVTGRSYGGYLTLCALAFTPEVFVAGVDVCGMSDLLAFYEETEPWIAEAAVTKYGDPVADRALLEAISPLNAADRIRSPLLVVHGELDTNVPIGEARRIVARLEQLGREVEYLELPGEGHEYRRVESRRTLVDAMLRFLAPRLLGSAEIESRRRPR